MLIYEKQKEMLLQHLIASLNDPLDFPNYYPQAKGGIAILAEGLINRNIRYFYKVVPHQ